MSGHRAEAERLWPLRTELVPLRRPGLRGALTFPLKLLLQPLVRWYVAPLVDAQRDFNDIALKLIDDLERRLNATTDPRRLDEIEERLFRIERVRRPEVGDAPRALLPSHAQGEGAPFDYFAFETRMRGSTSDIRARQAEYVEAVSTREPVLDLGCGRGEFLQALGDAGVRAVGVDADPDMVAFSQALGLDVRLDDGLAFLEKQPPASFGAIFAAQVVEHLPPARIVSLLDLAASRLREDGLLILETMNPLALNALKNFFADLTHQQPLVPQTLVFLAQQAGFRNIAIRYLHAPPPDARLQRVELPLEPRFADARVALDANIAHLNEILFGHEDYVLTAHR